MIKSGAGSDQSVGFMGAEPRIPAFSHGYAELVYFLLCTYSLAFSRQKKCYASFLVTQGYK
ncbi:hypothetical protein [Amphritea japonica]|uniref:hypothetical protein n=1 Tax=Amphritea japonica TaxID=452627 RepID=UPI00036820DE|nr:hypothetical protein [Amphritea japonica]